MAAAASGTSRQPLYVLKTELKGCTSVTTATYALVSWSGQAKAFDGAYVSYDNKSPVCLLEQRREQGRDFRWFCTMCYAHVYARWWNMPDLSDVRKRLGLEAKLKVHMTRARKWREEQRIGCTKPS